MLNIYINSDWSLHNRVMSCVSWLIPIQKTTWCTRCQNHSKSIPEYVTETQTKINEEIVENLW